MIGCCVCQKQREKIVNSYASVFIRDKCCCHLMWWSLIEKYTPIVNRWPKVHSHHTTTQSFRWKFRFDSWIILCKKMMMRVIVSELWMRKTLPLPFFFNINPELFYCKKIAQKCLTVAERGAKVQTASTMGRDRSILLRHSWRRRDLCSNDWLPRVGSWDKFCLSPCGQVSHYVPL